MKNLLKDIPDFSFLIKDFEDKTQNVTFIHNEDTINWNNYDVAVIGIDYDTDFESINNIRKHLYSLFLPSSLNVLDLGNFWFSDNYEESTENLKAIFDLISSNDIKLAVIGSESVFNVVFFDYFVENKLTFSNLSIDSSLNYTHKEIERLSSDNFLNYLVSNTKNVDRIIHLGHQNFLVNPLSLKDFVNKGNIAYRLSEVQSDFLDLEPEFRDVDVINLSLSAVRFSDAPGAENSLPNGFNTYEICKLANFSGLSDNVKIFGLYNYNSQNDVNDVGAKLSAQVIWHFFDAFSRKKYFSELKHNDYSSFYTKFILDGDETEFKFVHCEKTDRWWFVIRYSKFEKMLPCSFKDYENIKNGTLSRRLKAYLDMYFVK